MKILLLISIIILALVPLVITQSDLVFKQNTGVDLKIPVFFNGTIASASATCNISIFEPDGDILINNQLMGNQLAFHNWTLSPSQTLNIGEHTTSIYCTDQGFNDFSTFSYLISPSGTDDDNIAQIVLLSFGLIFSVGGIWFGFNKQDPIFVLFGGFLLVSVGLYTLLNGIAVYRNNLTQAISLIVMGIASYISIRTGMEMIDG